MTSNRIATPAWERRPLTIKQSFVTALVLATYTGVLTYIVVIYAHAFRSGFLLGLQIAGIGWVLIFSSSFASYSIMGRRVRVEIPVAESVSHLREVLGPIQAKAEHEITTSSRQWHVLTHVVDRGLGVGVDLNDLESASAKAAVEICLSVRHRIGRVTFVTGKGGESSRNPELRTQTLMQLATAEIIADFHLWKKRSTITLRPRKPPMPRREFLIKMAALGGPLAGFGAIGFMDAAQANTLSGVVGAGAGLFLTWLLITHSR